MADTPRIEELRRRIQKDPASIAFAQLAEEHRRAGQFEEAVRVCRAGLAQHPAYLSARITLGRALLEMARYDEAASEFEYVLKAAPDNLTAVRELADIDQRRRASAGAVAPRVEAAQAAPLDSGGGPRRDPAGSVSAEPDVPQDHPTPAIDPVVAELEAWLAVITEDRAARPARI